VTVDNADWYRAGSASRPGDDVPQRYTYSAQTTEVVSCGSLTIAISCVVARPSAGPVCYQLVVVLPAHPMPEVALVFPGARSATIPLPCRGIHCCAAVPCAATARGSSIQRAAAVFVGPSRRVPHQGLRPGAGCVHLAPPFVFR
jgi:hypothetical protein